MLAIRCGVVTEALGMSTTFFCPSCGKQGPDDDAVCPSCGKSTRHWREHAFEERLLLTLHHPIQEHRMMAIQILGQRKYKRAVPFFAEMIAAGQDVYTLSEIVYALSQMNTEDSRQLITKLRKHPSAVVRTACDEAASVLPEGDSR
jgi:predicted amidophosphoribosyltransferase